MKSADTVLVFCISNKIKMLRLSAVLRLLTKILITHHTGITMKLIKKLIMKLIRNNLANIIRYNQTDRKVNECDLVIFKSS